MPVLIIRKPIKNSKSAINKSIRQRFGPTICCAVKASRKLHKLVIASWFDYQTILWGVSLVASSTSIFSGCCCHSDHVTLRCTLLRTKLISAPMPRTKNLELFGQLKCNVRLEPRVSAKFLLILFLDSSFDSAFNGLSNDDKRLTIFLANIAANGFGPPRTMAKVLFYRSRK